MHHKEPVQLRVNFILDDKEVDRLIHSLDDRQWVAVRQVVLEHIEQETQVVTDPKNTRTDFYAGRLASLRDLLSALAFFRDEGGKLVSEDDL